MKKVVIAVLFAILASTTISAQESNRRTEMKSAVITMTSELMEQTLITMKYIDDYGNKHAQFTMTPFYEDGKRIDSLIVGRVRVNGKDITIDYINKCLSVKENESGFISFLNLNDDVIKKYKIKKLGEEEVCGKPCTKYSMSYKINGLKTKDLVWVWKGVTLKRRVISFVSDREVVATDIQEDVPIDPSVFVVPDYPLEQRKP